MAVEENHYANNYSETTVKAPVVPFEYDLAHHVSHIEKMTEYHKNLNEGIV